MRLPDSQTNLRRYDLNLLPILKVLLATQSVARAAEVLGMSQSAISGALSRLRTMFGDPLLILVGRNLAPTPRALELLPVVDQAFVDLFRLFDQRAFVPLEEERCFVISTADAQLTRLATPLLELMAAAAPKASVRFIELSAAHVDSMQDGDIDFVLSPRVGPRVSNDTMSRTISKDRMVIISSDRFEMPAGGLDLETYLAARHASYRVAGGETIEQRALMANKLVQNSLIAVPLFTLLPEIVCRTNCLAMMPKLVAEPYAAKLPLRIWDVPFETPDIEFALYWSPLFNSSPAHLWFRELIVRAWTQAQGRPTISFFAEDDSAADHLRTHRIA